MIVLDASAACEIASDTPIGNALEALMLVDEQVVSCDLIRAELANVNRRLVNLRKFEPQVAQSRFQKAVALVDCFYPIEELEIEALAEGIRLNHSTCDMFYFVLARRFNATLFTTDQKLIALCDQNGVNCVHEIDLPK